jgi:hypothetical protein
VSDAGPFTELSDAVSATRRWMADEVERKKRKDDRDQKDGDKAISGDLG